MKTTGKKINGRKVFTYVFLTIAALISLFPFYFMFVSATNTNAEILSATPKLIFGSHLVENFKNLNKKMDILRILMNSTIMTVTYTALSTVDGKIIAYPWDSGPCGMFYRSDLFEEAGIKAEDIVTWDDFIEAGKVLKEKTGVNMLCMAESRNDTTYRLLMMEGGGFYFDKDGNTQVDSDVSIQAMETCKKMYDAGITFNNSSWDDMVAGMGADKFACIADAVWMVGSIKEAAPDQSGKWAVMELPRFQADKEAQGASNGGSVLAVPSASKSTEASKAFVKFVMENVDANVEGFQNYGLYPSYLKALESDVFKEGDEFFGGQQIFDLFTEVGKTVPQVNYTSNFAEALEMSKNSMANILLNDEDPAEVLKAEQEEMKAKFGK